MLHNMNINIIRDIDVFLGDCAKLLFSSGTHVPRTQRTRTDPFDASRNAERLAPPASGDVACVAARTGIVIQTVG